MKNSKGLSRILVLVLLAVVLIISLVRLVFNIQEMDTTRIILNLIIVACMLGAIFINGFSDKYKKSQKQR